MEWEKQEERQPERDSTHSNSSSEVANPIFGDRGDSGEATLLMSCFVAILYALHGSQKAIAIF